MRSLLSKRDQRHLRFLELLIEEDSLTLEEASRLSRYPVRTLADDIGNINTYIYPSRIRTSTSGLSLYIPAESSIRDVYSKLLRQSREYRLLFYLFHNRGKTQEELANSQYVSISTMQRIIKTMNPVLAQYGIAIKSGAFGMELAGDETRVASLYIALFSEWYYDGAGPMTAEERELLLELNQKMTGRNRFSLYYADMKRITLWIYVHIVRVRQKCFKPQSALWEREQVAAILDDRDFCSRFEAAFGIALDDDLLFCLYRNFLRFEFANDLAGLQAIAARDERLKKLDGTIQRLLNDVASSFSISMADTHVLRMILFNTIQVPDTPPYALYNKNAVFVQEYQKDNIPAARVILGYVRQAFPEAGEDEINKIAYCLITHWPNLILRIERHVPDVHVGIFFDSDIEHAEMIADLLKVKSPVKMRVWVPTATNIESLAEWCRDIDIMITNIPFLRSTCGETICIQEYPSARNWAAIMRAMEKAYADKWHSS